MGLLDLFKKKGSSDVAKDRLKLLLVLIFRLHQRNLILTMALYQQFSLIFQLRI